MKKTPCGCAASACVLAGVLIGASAATLGAQTPLQAQLAIRPLSRDDITIYRLPATIQTSGGLSTVGVGQPAYLEAQINIAIPASDIAGVVWELTSKPPAGEPKAALSISDSWTQPQLQAAYNWPMVTEDGSRGIHNMAYTGGAAQGFRRRPLW